MNKIKIAALAYSLTNLALELALSVTAAIVNYKLGVLVLALVMSRRVAEAVHNLEVAKMEAQHRNEMMTMLSQTFTTSTKSDASSNEQYERNSTLQ